MTTGSAGPPVLHAAALREWAASGTWHEILGESVFAVDLAPEGPERHEPLLVIHGFPTSSVDFHRVATALRQGRRVILPDMLGYGLSSKPDRPYSVALQADLLMELTTRLGLTELSLLTHDVGDTVGGELLARQLDGEWPVRIVRRVVTNGSIYIESAHLTDGQLLLLSLPDELLPADFPINRDTMTASLRATFSPGAPVPDEDLEAAWEAISYRDGHRVLPRLIRYIEERRRNERRFTGAIERHGSPLTIVWGADDPIAIKPMADRLHQAVPGSTLVVLDGVGHYPMVEDPDRFSAAASAGQNT